MFNFIFCSSMCGSFLSTAICLTMIINKIADTNSCSAAATTCALVFVLTIAIIFLCYAIKYLLQIKKD